MPTHRRTLSKKAKRGHTQKNRRRPSAKRRQHRVGSKKTMKKNQKAGDYFGRSKKSDEEYYDIIKELQNRNIGKKYSRFNGNSNLKDKPNPFELDKSMDEIIKNIQHNMTIPLEYGILIKSNDDKIIIIYGVEPSKTVSKNNRTEYSIHTLNTEITRKSDTDLAYNIIDNELNSMREVFMTSVDSSVNHIYTSNDDPATNPAFQELFIKLTSGNVQPVSVENANFEKEKNEQFNPANTEEPVVRRVLQASVPPSVASSTASSRRSSEELSRQESEVPSEVSRRSSVASNTYSEYLDCHEALNDLKDQIMGIINQLSEDDKKKPYVTNIVTLINRYG